jgi:hypothetical protein
VKSIEWKIAPTIPSAAQMAVAITPKIGGDAFSAEYGRTDGVLESTAVCGIMPQRTPNLIALCEQLALASS